MKFSVATALSLLLTESCALALRGSTSDNPSPARRHLLGADTECVTLLRIVDYEDGPDEEDWTCQFSREDAKRFNGAFMMEIEGLTKEEMDSMGAISGGTVLKVGPSSYVETHETHNIFTAAFDKNYFLEKPPVLHVSPKEFAIEEMDEYNDARHYKYRRAMRERRQRRLAQSTGTLETLVLRVIDEDGKKPPRASKLQKDIFRDRVSLKKQFNKCSHGNIEIKQVEDEGMSTKSGVQGIVNIDYNAKAYGSSTYYMWSTALAAAEAEYQRDFSVDYDLVMICQPWGTYDSRGSRGWIGYAYTNDYVSVYNDEWCGYVSIQMHEIGHNMGLSHSGDRDGSPGREQYSDQTGMMGFSYASDDFPEMCFNSAKAYQLGWYPDQMISIDPLDPLDLPNNYVDFTLNGVVDYNTSNGYVTIRLEYTGDQKGGIDYYIGYNRQTDFNIETQRDGNLVQILEKVNNEARSDRNGPGTSWIIASLDDGDDFDLDIGDTTINILVTDILDENAFITISNGELPTVAPSLAPSSAPTLSSAPTWGPTSAPSSAPSSAPTSAPTLSSAPTSAPTSAPSSAPTSAPTRVCTKQENPTTRFTLHHNNAVRRCSNIEKMSIPRKKNFCAFRVVAPRNRRVRQECPVTCGKVGQGQCAFLEDYQERALGENKNMHNTAQITL